MKLHVPFSRPEALSWINKLVILLSTALKDICLFQWGRRIAWFSIPAIGLTNFLLLGIPVSWFVSAVGLCLRLGFVSGFCIFDSSM
jgi:hypothetical protein